MCITGTYLTFKNLVAEKGKDEKTPKKNVKNNTEKKTLGQNTIRNITKANNIAKCIVSLKWQRTGHLVRREDERWTKNRAETKAEKQKVQQTERKER